MKKLSKVFRIAVPHVNSDVSKFGQLCSAVNRALGLGKITAEEATEAKDHIQNMLGYNYTVTSWLRQQGVVLPDDDDAAYVSAVIDYRRRWIAHIIQTLEEQGK